MHPYRAAAALTLGAALVVSPAMPAWSYDDPCRGNAGKTLTIYEGLRLPVGKLEVRLARKLGCMPPALSSEPDELWEELVIANPAVPGGTTVSVHLQPQRWSEQAFIVQDDKAILVRTYNGPRDPANPSMVIAVARPSAEGVALEQVAPVGEQVDPLKAISMWGRKEALPPFLHAVFPDAQISVLASRWLEIEEGRILDLSTRSVRGFEAKVGDLSRAHVVGMGPDERTLVWVGERDDGGYTLVLTDTLGAGSVEHRLDGLTTHIQVLGGGLDVSEIDAAWVHRFFAVEQEPGKPMRLKRRAAASPSEPPRFVHQDRIWYLGCVQPELAEAVLSALEVDFGAKVDPSPNARPQDLASIYSCKDRRGETALGQITWYFTIDGNEFALTLSANAKLSLMFLRPAGGKLFEQTDEERRHGAVLSEAIARHLSAKLREPEWRRFLHERR